MVNRVVVIVVMLLLVAILMLMAYSLCRTAIAPPAYMVHDLAWRAAGVLLAALFAIVASVLGFAAYRTAREGAPWE